MHGWMDGQKEALNSILSKAQLKVRGEFSTYVFRSSPIQT